MQPQYVQQSKANESGSEAMGQYEAALASGGGMQVDFQEIFGFKLDLRSMLQVR